MAFVTHAPSTLIEALTFTHSRQDCMCVYATSKGCRAVGKYPSTIGKNLRGHAQNRREGGCSAFVLLSIMGGCQGVRLFCAWNGVVKVADLIHTRGTRVGCKCRRTRYHREHQYVDLQCSVYVLLICVRVIIKCTSSGYRPDATTQQAC